MATSTQLFGGPRYSRGTTGRLVSSSKGGKTTYYSGGGSTGQPIKTVSKAESGGQAPKPQGPVQQDGSFTSSGQKAAVQESPTSTTQTTTQQQIQQVTRPVQSAMRGVLKPYNMISTILDGNKGDVSGSATYYGGVGEPSRIVRREVTQEGGGIETIRTYDIKSKRSTVPISVQGPLTKEGSFFKDGGSRPDQAVRTDWVGEARSRTTYGGLETYQEIDTRKSLTASLSRTGVTTPSEDISSIRGRGKSLIPGIYQSLMGVAGAGDQRISQSAINIGLTDEYITKATRSSIVSLAGVFGIDKQRIVPDRLDVATEYGTGVLTGLRDKSVTTGVKTVGFWGATKIIGGSKIIQGIVTKFPKSTLATSYGIAGVYGVSVAARAVASERPAYTLGRITTTEALPIMTGVYLGTKSLQRPTVSEPLYTKGKVTMAGVERSAIRVKYMPKDSAFVYGGGISESNIYSSFGYARIGPTSPSTSLYSMGNLQLGRIATTKGSLSFISFGKGYNIATAASSSTSMSGLSAPQKLLSAPQGLLTSSLKSSSLKPSTDGLLRLSLARTRKPLTSKDLEIFATQSTKEGLTTITQIVVPEQEEPFWKGEYTLRPQKRRFQELRQMFSKQKQEYVVISENVYGFRSPEQAQKYLQAGTIKQSLQQTTRSSIITDSSKSLSNVMKQELVLPKDAVLSTVKSNVLSRSSSRQSQSLIFGQSLGQAQRLSSISALSLATSQTTLSALILIPKLSFSTASTRPPPVPPPVPPPIVTFGFPALSWGAFLGKKRTVRQRSKFKPRITPSVTGAAFKIKGKKPKGIDIFAGIRARPIF